MNRKLKRYNFFSKGFFFNESYTFSEMKSEIRKLEKRKKLLRRKLSAVQYVLCTEVEEDETINEIQKRQENDLRKEIEILKVQLTQRLQQEHIVRVYESKR